MAFKPLVILDSGAFSAWTRHEEINLDEYIQFCKDHSSHFCSVVALDKMPGEKGRTARDAATMELAASTSYANFDRIRKEGVETIPVFHMGEDFKWLEKLVAEKVPYIGISRYMKANEHNVIHWMDEVFSRLTDVKGRPIVRTHGFGVTATAYVHRYPWFTIDSASWTLSAGYGVVRVPRVIGDRFDFTYPSEFYATERDQALGGGVRNMVNTTPAMREALDRYFHSLGSSFQEVQNLHGGRWLVNAAYYRGLEAQLASLGPRPFKFRLGRIKPKDYKHRTSNFTYTPRIHMADKITVMEQHEVLTKLQIPGRLLSYHEIRYKEPGLIVEYCSNGFRKRATDFMVYKIGTPSWKARRRMLFIRRMKRLLTEISEYE